MDSHAKFGRQFVTFSKSLPMTPTEMLDGLQKLEDSLQSVFCSSWEDRNSSGMNHSALRPIDPP